MYLHNCILNVLLFIATDVLVVNFIAKNLPLYLNDSSLRYVSL